MRTLYFLVFLFPVLFFINSCSSNDPTMYQLTIITIPEEGGVVTPERTSFEEGREIEIFANPNDHWVFSRWDGDFEGTENNSIITMDEDKEIIAIFAKRDYALTVTIEGEGSVIERIVRAKSTDYEHNTTVELTAEPENGWEFVEWQGDLSGSENPQNVVIEGDTEVVAIFNRITYPLTIEIIGEGSVEEEILPGKTTDYEIGTAVQLTAVPDDGYLFYEWSGDIGDITPNSNPVIIEMNEAKVVTAEFKEGFELVAIAVPEGAGTIEPGNGVFISGSSVTVEATPEYGWRFVEWSGDFTGTTNPFDLTMSGDIALNGHFERLSYPVSVLSEPVDGGKVEITVVEGSESLQSPGEYLYESLLELTAVPEPGWEFAEWQGDIGSADPTQNPISVEVTEAMDIHAVYSIIPGTLNVTNSTFGQGIPESIAVRISEELSGDMAPNDTLRFENLVPGLYDVEVERPLNCAPLTPLLQKVTVRAGQETSVNFRFNCGLIPFGQ